MCQISETLDLIWYSKPPFKIWNACENEQGEKAQKYKSDGFSLQNTTKSSTKKKQNVPSLKECTSLNGLPVVIFVRVSAVE